jgi:hypothetical protein
MSSTPKDKTTVLTCGLTDTNFLSLQNEYKYAVALWDKLTDRESILSSIAYSVRESPSTIIDLSAGNSKEAVLRMKTKPEIIKTIKKQRTLKKTMIFTTKHFIIRIGSI